jgi:hypothetical protein
MIQYQQYELALIPHKVAGEIISQRAKDGYINATAMCTAAGKQWGHYRESSNTQRFLEELASDIGKPISELVQSIKGGKPALQGTWVHPQVAIHLAQWLSPRFAVMVSRWVHEWLTKGAPNIIRPMPFHLRRYLANHPNVPSAHFSILNAVAHRPVRSAGLHLA